MGRQLGGQSGKKKHLLTQAPEGADDKSLLSSLKPKVHVFAISTLRDHKYCNT